MRGTVSLSMLSNIRTERRFHALYFPFSSVRRKRLAGIPRQAFLFAILLLAQQCGIRRRVVRLHHVDCESIILIRIPQTIRDVRFRLSVTADVFHIEIQNIIILL